MSVNEMASSSGCSLRKNWSDRGIPVEVFNTSSITRRVKRTYEKFKERPLPPTFKARLDGPSSTWKVYSRLQMATSYADTSTKDCMVFSFEDKISNDGQRMFLVAHPEQMWQNHRTRQLEERCTYEVIRENHPCKLYFDLEFYTSLNTEKDGNIMTEVFIKCVIATMYDQHNLLLKKSDFLWLDASNELKFSSHLILQMKGIAFQNNIEAGVFVSLLTTTLRKRIDENTPAEGLWPSADQIKMLLVKSKKEKEAFFCDEGVYTRNRNFRMFLSTKHGKKSPLLLSVHNEYVPSMSAKYQENEAIFYDSLITYFRNQEIIKYLKYDEIQSNICSQIPSFRRRNINRHDVSGFTSSPFPDIDSFIVEKIKDDFAVGFIRKWSYFCNEQKIVYDVGNYRFCSNIGRHHKSNNIKIVVDMKNKCYYQTCLDPDCRQEGYRSEATALPDDIVFLSVPEDFFDVDCFSQLQSKDNEDENFGVSSHSDSISLNDNFLQNYFTDFCDFSQLSKRNNSVATNHGNYTMPSQCQLNQASWDAFFLESIGMEDKESIGMEDKESIGMEENNEIYSIPPLDNNCTWSCDSISDDSAVFLHNVSLEDEMLMVEAAEATEVAINGSIFSEETVF